MNEISSIFIDNGSSKSVYDIKDALVRSYALSSGDLSIGINDGTRSLDLVVKDGVAGSVPLSVLGGGTAVTLYDEIAGQAVRASDLSIMKLTRETYDYLSSHGQLLSDGLYIVDCKVPDDLSDFANSPGYITLSDLPSLSAYKTYDETVGSLSNGGYVTDSDLTAYYKKTETSSSQ